MFSWRAGCAAERRGNGRGAGSSDVSGGGPCAAGSLVSCSGFWRGAAGPVGSLEAWGRCGYRHSPASGARRFPGHSPGAVTGPCYRPAVATKPLDCLGSWRLVLDKKPGEGYPPDKGRVAAGQRNERVLGQRDHQRTTWPKSMRNSGRTSSLRFRRFGRQPRADLVARPLPGRSQR